MLSLALLIAAVVVFILACIPMFTTHYNRLVALGLACLAGSMLAPAVGG